MNLDSVIRQIAKREEILPGETLVIIDAKTGEAIDKIPGMLSFRAVNLYAVSNVQTANCAGTNYKLSSGVLIEISFAAGVPSGREQMAAQALQHFRNQRREATLEAALNSRVKQWTADFIRDHREEQVLDLQTELQVYLKNQALAEIGLHLRPNVAFKHDGQLEPLPVLAFAPFPVHVQDFDNALLVSYEGELAVCDPIRAVSQWKKPEEIHDIISTHIQAYCRQRLTLNQFADGFKTSVRDEIVQELNLRFEPFGRRFNFLNLKIESNLLLKPEKRIFQFEETVKEKIKDFGSDITVQNRVLIEVADLARFRTSKESTELDKWVHDVVQSAVKKRLMAATYKKLLLDQESFVQEVRDIIRAEADKIGLRITEHIVLPELKERRLVSEGFTVQRQNLQFQTGGSDQMPVALNIFVKGRLDENGLQELNEIYLGEKADVFKSIETAILGKLRESIILRSAEKMFLKFEVPAPSESSSTQELLCTELRALLIGEFKAKPDSLQIVINHGQNELITKARALLGRTNNLLHMHKALGGNGADLKYDFQYRIMRVRDDGWFQFFQNAETRTPDEIVREINLLLGGRIDYVFQNFRFEEKVATGIEAEKFRREALSRGAFDPIGRVFGLEIQLINHQRDVYQHEREAEENFRKQGEVIGQLEFESSKKALVEGYTELDKLRKKLREEKSEEMPDNREIARIERHIKVLEEEIKKDKFTSIRNERETFLSSGSLTNFESPQIGDGDSVEDEN